MRTHLSPSALALLLDCALGCLGAQVVGDDGTGMLHVQEVRSERALGRVGVMLALLALLLLLDGRDHFVGDSRHHQLGSGILKVGQEVDLAALRGGLAKEQVGLANIVMDEVLKQVQDGSQATDSLERVC